MPPIPKEDPLKRKVVPFLNTFNWVSARDLEEIMEWLGDNKMLNEGGQRFRNYFWKLFIKEVKK